MEFFLGGGQGDGDGWRGGQSEGVREGARAEPGGARGKMRRAFLRTELVAQAGIVRTLFIFEGY